jgi:hypothetical protein
LNIDEKEYVEDKNSSSKLLHGKWTRKGATCETR